MAASPTSFRSLVLPREHGSWSLTFEPVALGLLVAPSRAGAWLALAVGAGFFVRRPLKLFVTLLSDDPRAAAALRWAGAFSAVACAALGLAAWTSGGWWSLWPLLLAAPCGAAFLWFDLRGEMREAEAEIAGSLAFALVPTAFATLAGWSAATALALAVPMIVRSVPTVLTVRTYLRFAKRAAASAWPALGAALVGLALVSTLAVQRLVPVAAVALAALLALRSAWLLSRVAPTWSARRVGVSEAVLGAVNLAVLGYAYHLV